jgi:hypothetical protein
MSLNHRRRLRACDGELVSPTSPFNEWWSRTGSNRRPEACKATALPTELRPRSSFQSFRCPPSRKALSARPPSHLSGLPRRSSHRERRLVGPDRFELSTPRLSSVCSNQLSYGPSPAWTYAMSVGAATGLVLSTTSRVSQRSQE